MNICPECKNLSDNCLICGGTNKTKDARNGLSVCPVCHNQSDYCMLCGGNMAVKKKLEEEEDEDDYDPFE